MTTNKDGGPAFPSVGEGFGNPSYSAPGMTLRDWFATHATEADIAAILNPQHWSQNISRYEARYIHADAMLVAREVKP
jgi:hypothetical protein